MYFCMVLNFENEMYYIYLYCIFFAIIHSWYINVYPVILHIYMILNLKWSSNRQDDAVLLFYLYVYLFLIYYVNLYFLIAVFIPLGFSNNWYVVLSLSFYEPFFFYFLHLFFVFLFVFLCFIWTFFEFYLGIF